MATKCKKCTCDKGLCTKDINVQLAQVHERMLDIFLDSPLFNPRTTPPQVKTATPEPRIAISPFWVKGASFAEDFASVSAKIDKPKAAPIPPSLQDSLGDFDKTLNELMRILSNKRF